MKIDDAKTRPPSPSLKKNLDTSRESQVRVSTFTDQKRSEISYLSVNQLAPYRNQSRTIFNEEEIDALAEIIKEHGVRQPLTVLRINDEVVRFEVVSGERRLRAAKKIGLTQIPCIIIHDANKAEEIALIENIQRSDLHPLELAKGLNKLVEKIGNGAQSELKKRMGIPQSKISELLKLLTLSPSVQQALLDHDYRRRDQLRSLFKIKTEEEQLARIMKKLIPKKEALKTKKKLLLL